MLGATRSCFGSAVQIGGFSKFRNLQLPQIYTYSGISKFNDRSQDMLALKSSDFYNEAQSGASFMTEKEAYFFLPELKQKEKIAEAADVMISNDSLLGFNYTANFVFRGVVVDGRCGLGQLSLPSTVAGGQLEFEGSDACRSVLDRCEIFGRLGFRGASILSALIKRPIHRTIITFMLYRPEGSFGMTLDPHVDIGPAFHIPLFSKNAKGGVTYLTHNEIVHRNSESDLPSFTDNERWKHLAAVGTEDQTTEGVRLMMNIRDESHCA